MGPQGHLRVSEGSRAQESPALLLAQADRWHFPSAQPLAPPSVALPTHALHTDLPQPACCPPSPPQRCRAGLTPSLPATPPAPFCLTLTQRLVSGAGILSLLWKWEPAQPSRLTEYPKTHTASRADTPLTTCDDRDVLLSVILTRSRSLYLPAHPPGHLSSKIVCTCLAPVLILSLLCWRLVLAWPGCLQGAMWKDP